MATREEMMEALRRADAAGAADDARELARRIQAMPAENAAPQESPEFAAARNQLSMLTQKPSTAEGDRATFDNLPMWQKPLIAATDTATMMMEGATFGYGDKAVAGIRSAVGAAPSYEEELARQRELTQKARNRAGSAGTAAEIGGMLMPASVVAKTGVTPFALVNKASGLGSRAVQSAAAAGIEGTAYGALSAAGHDQDIEKGASDGMLAGAIGGAGGEIAGTAISKGLGYADDVFRKVTGKAPRQAPRRTVGDLRNAKNAAYQRVDDLGVEYSPQSIEGLHQGITDDVARLRLDPTLHRGAASVRRVVDDRLGPDVASGGPVGPRTIHDLDTIRQIANRDIQSPERGADVMRGAFVNNIDEFVDSAGPGNVTTRSGSPEQGAAAMREARALNSQMEKLDLLDNRLAKASRADARSRNPDMDGRIKANIDQILGNDNLRKGFTADEVKLMEEVVTGTKGTRALRRIGKLDSLIGGGMGGAIGTAAWTLGGGPLAMSAGLALPMAGKLANRSASKSTSRSLDRLLDTIANGSVRAPAPKNAAQKVTESNKEAIARFLTLAGVGQ